MSNKKKPKMILKATASFGSTSTSAKLKVYNSCSDFVPVVTIIEPTKKDEFSIKNNENNEKINLGPEFLDSLKNYIVPEILITQKSNTGIKLKVIQGNAASGFLDDDGVIEFQCSNKNVIIEDKKVDCGDEIEIIIEHNLNIGDKFSIDIKAKDNEDEMFFVSKKIVTSGKLNITVSEYLQDIPNISLFNYKCLENCHSYDNNDISHTPPKTEWKKGIRYDCTNNGLDLFSKTKEGQKILRLFMKIDSKFYSFTSDCEGEYSNKHTLMFVESTSILNKYANIENACKRRFPKYNNIDISTYANSKLDMAAGSDLLAKEFAKNPKLYYTMIRINLYPNVFLKSQKKYKWTDARLNAEMAHTIAHELFIHGYRKAILLMESWDNDFDNFDEIYSRDTGFKGNHDHAAYIQNYKDEGLNIMRAFQRSLSVIVGSKMANEVKKYHDATYQRLKNSKIPK